MTIVARDLFVLGKAVGVIEIALYTTAGFLSALFLALLIAPMFIDGAVKAAILKLKAGMPYSIEEMEADKDQLRASHAVELRRIEIERDKTADKATAHELELRSLREKLSGANKISKANKLALEEMHDKQAELNEKLRRSEAKYAALEARARQTVREKNELQFKVKKIEQAAKAGKPSAVNGLASLSSDEVQKSAGGLPIADKKTAIRPNDELRIVDLEERLDQERKRVADLQARLAQGTGETGQSYPVIGEDLFNMAAKISQLTAMVEGPNSPIHEMLKTDEASNVGSLSEKIGELINASEQGTFKPKARARRKKEKVTAMPKAQGLDIATPVAAPKPTVRKKKVAKLPAAAGLGEQT